MATSDKELRKVVPMRVYFLRHSISDNNAGQRDDERAGVEGATGRQADPGITQAGRDQAKLAGDYFNNLNSDDTVAEYMKVGRLYCSLMIRALRTVEAMGLADCVPRYAMPDLHEEGGLFNGERTDNPEDHAHVHGLTKDEIARIVKIENLADVKEEKDGGWWVGGKETDESCEDRAKVIGERLWRMAEDRAKASSPGRAVLVITHGLIHDRLKRYLVTGGSPPPASHNCIFPTSNGGIDTFEFKIHPDTNQRLLAVVGMNDHSYVPSDLKNGHTCGAFRI